MRTMSRTPAKTPEQSIAVVGSSPTSSDEAIRLHATGHSRFICDEPTPDRMCYVEPVVSPHAHARIRGIDATEARRVKGVVAVLTAHDIPGENQIGVKIKDEPLLPEDEACYIGQPTGLVVAATRAAAKRAAAAVRVDYEPLEPILTIADARRVDSLITAPIQVVCGDVESTLTRARHVLEGEIVTPLQEHVYFETQRVRVIPGEGREILLQAGTQSPSEVQQLVARVLGLSRKDVSIDVRRLGGAFGGKESAASLWCCLAALASRCTGRPIELCLSREQDMAWTGKRHPYSSDFRLGLDEDGKFLTWEVEYYQNGGSASDLSTAIMERTLFHATGSYFIPNVKVTGICCRTNLPPNTAFRGFGAPQAMFVMEAAIRRASRRTGIPVEELQRKNLLKKDDILPYGMAFSENTVRRSWMRAEELTSGISLRTSRQNGTGSHLRKGFSFMPVCFGISFTNTSLNQASALVHVYTDGSVGVSTGAVEMGQGVNTKIAQVAARAFGVGISRIKVESTNTTRAANTSPTAASSGADMNGNATRIACGEIKRRLLCFAGNHLRATGKTLEIEAETVTVNGKPTGLKWLELINLAYLSRVSLSCQAHYATPGIHFDKETERGVPFAYHVAGTAVTEVTVDTLRGTWKVDSVTVVHDGGESINPLIDRGQIEGGLLQGIGWVTMEDVGYDQGVPRSSLAVYKIPDIHSMPSVISIEFLPCLNSNAGVYNSKAVGEPPFMYGIGTYFALINALPPELRPEVHAAPLTCERLFGLVRRGGTAE